MKSVSRPHNLTFLGEGQNGIVLLVDGTSVDARRVVKITYSDPFVKEAKIAKQLEVLKPETQAFIATFGWYEREGLEPSWVPMLPPRRQDGTAIDWSKYAHKKLTYIFMEHSNFRIDHPNPSAPGGVVFWQHVSAENAKKLLFILLHGLYVARKRLQFSHNDIHDGQIMLFRRDRNVPVILGREYEIQDCFLIPKFIDFGASIIVGTESNEISQDSMFSDDVGRLVITFHEIHTQDDVMDTLEFEKAAGSSRSNYKVIKELMGIPYFKEFRRTRKREKAVATCIGCMGKATHVIQDTVFHVCGEYCASKIFA